MVLATASWFTVAELQAASVLRVEDGNHGEYRPRPHEFTEDGCALYIRAADIREDRIRYNSAKAISDSALQRVRKGIGAGGDVLFSHKGTVGKLALVPLDAPVFVCSPQTTFWRTLAEDRLDRQFLYAYLRSPHFRQQWFARKGETDMADYVSLTAQRKLKIPLPPIDWQRRVGVAVAMWDSLIEINRQRIEMLEEVARQLYREWFVYFRFPGYEGVELTASDIGLIPEGWSQTCLAEKLELQRINIKPFEFANEEFEHYSIPSFDDRRLPSLELGSEIRSGKYLLTGESVMVSKLNPQFPRVWRVDRSNRPRRAVASTEFLVLTSPDQWTLSFVYGLVTSSEFSARLATTAGGTSTSHQRVKPTDVLSMPVVSPPLEVVQRYSSQVQPILKLADSLIEQVEVLREARDLLLPRFVSGELDVSELDLGLAAV